MGAAWLLCDSVLVMGEGAAKTSASLTIVLFGIPIAWAAAHAAAGWVAASLRLQLGLALQNAVAGHVSQLARADAPACPGRREALLTQGAMEDVCRDQTEFFPWLCAAAISFRGHRACLAAVCAGGHVRACDGWARGAARGPRERRPPRLCGGDGSDEGRGVDGYLRRDLTELDAYASLGAADGLLASQGEKRAHPA